jgi:16S rRNA (guanine527-N7)-methyltransferase
MESMRQQVIDGAAAMELLLAEEVVDRLLAHAEAVIAANETMNLTTIAPEDYAGLHILDSLSALPQLLAAPRGIFADLGSGAGFPGIPLAIATGREVHLVESVRKKAAFLTRVCAELRLEATVHPIRAEELAPLRAGAYSAVVARALSSLPSLVELAAPLLGRDGVLICLKGAPEEAELKRGDAAAAICGLVREHTESVTVPFVAGQRTIVVYRKTQPARVRLPRRIGLAQRQPLA